MYARTTAGSAHGDFQDRNGVNYVTSAESFGHCSQLFWKKDPNDSGPTSTISWCDQLPTTSSLSLETRAAAAAAAAVIADMEADVRPYACDQCSCAYIHNSSLTNHKLTHRIGDFRCDFCAKPYNNYMSLRNHMRIHGSKRYMCDLCGKSFRLARYLRNHQKIHDDGPNRFDCPNCCKTFRTMLELAQHRCNNLGSQVRRVKSGSRRNNFGRHRQHQQNNQQNNTTAPMMQQQSHGGHGQQDPLPPHCVSPMSQGGGVVASNTIPDAHQGRSSSSSQSQASQQSMRSSSSSNKHSSSSSGSSYSLLQPLVPEVKEMSPYNRLNASNAMPKHQDTFSLAPQRPLTSINPISHSLHPNGAPALKPSPVPRTIQGMPWERSLYNQ